MANRRSICLQGLVKRNAIVALMMGVMGLSVLYLPPGIASAHDHKAGMIPDQTESGPHVSTQNPTETTPMQAAEFTLKDQHNRIHHYRFPRKTASVLLMADYEGSGQLEDWSRPIYAHVNPHVAIDGVADLSKAPRWMRGSVRTFFRGQLDYPVMLDGSGNIARLYQYQPGQANLFVIDHQLVTSNWLRTLTWSARGLVVLWMVKRLIPLHPS